MSCGIAIFVKTPSLSSVKTRLWPGIGRRRAEALYLSSAQAVASVAMQTRDQGGIEPYWAVAEDAALPAEAWTDLPQLPQGNGSLGERMAQVYARLRQAHHAAILIGADAPQLTAHALQRAAVWLSGVESRLAIGRAADGGFWLFGGNAPLHDLDTVDDIPHVRTGLAAVAAPTPAQLRLMGELEALSDIAEAST